MSRLNTLYLHAEKVRERGPSMIGNIPIPIYRSLCASRTGVRDATHCITAMQKLIIKDGLNQCLDYLL